MITAEICSQMEKCLISMTVREAAAEEESDSNVIRYIRGLWLISSDSEKAKTYYHYTTSLTQKNVGVPTLPEGSSLGALEGKVGPQGMGLYGGAHQAYIDYRAVPADWIEITPATWK